MPLRAARAAEAEAEAEADAEAPVRQPARIHALAYAQRRQKDAPGEAAPQQVRGQVARGCEAVADLTSVFGRANVDAVLGFFLGVTVLPAALPAVQEDGALVEATKRLRQRLGQGRHRKGCVEGALAVGALAVSAWPTGACQRAWLACVKISS